MSWIFQTQCTCPTATCDFYHHNTGQQHLLKERPHPPTAINSPVNSSGIATFYVGGRKESTPERYTTTNVRMSPSYTAPHPANTIQHIRLRSEKPYNNIIAQNSYAMKPQ